MRGLRIAAALFDDLTAIAVGALWRMAAISIITLPVWGFYV